jgi:hypothetical protein
VLVMAMVMLIPSPAHPNNEQDKHDDEGDKASTEVKKFQATCTVQRRPSGMLNTTRRDVYW